jgi:CDGSH-type Zn-finger protein
VTLPEPADSGLSIDLLPVGLRQRLSDEVVQALAMAGVAGRSEGRAEVTAHDLLDALVALLGTPAVARETVDEAGLPADDAVLRAGRVPSPARVTPYRDGPYLLRGPFELTDVDGEPIACARRTVALCRCGRSQMRPFCDGTHKLTGFRAESGAEGASSG